MNKPVAEFIGTFALVFIGCGAAVIGGMGSGATAIDVLGIAFAFGLAIVAMAYGIGPVSGPLLEPLFAVGAALPILPPRPLTLPLSCSVNASTCCAVTSCRAR